MEDKYKILQFICDKKNDSIPVDVRRIKKELLQDVSVEYINKLIEELKDFNEVKYVNSKKPYLKHKDGLEDYLESLSTTKITTYKAAIKDITKHIIIGIIITVVGGLILFLFVGV